MGERVPQHVQNIVIRNYCEINNYEYLLSATEYAMPKSSLVLNQTIIECNNYDGIVAYSLFQLPEIKKDRLKIVECITNQKKELHFAVESIKICSFQEYQEIEAMWQVRQVIDTHI